MDTLGIRISPGELVLTQSLFLFWSLYSWFSYDVIKIQTKKLSLLLSSTFMWYYKTLKPLYKKIFGSKGFFILRYRTLEFPGFYVTRHLADDGQESSYVGYKHNRFWEILLPKHSLSQNKYFLNLYEFLKQRIHALVGTFNNRCFCWFRAAIFVPLNGTQTWRFHTKLKNLDKTFFRISQI